MLTQRQIWRKQSFNHLRLGCDLTELEKEDIDQTEKVSDLSIDDDSADLKSNVDFHEIKIIDTIPKKIKFDVIVKVILIPSLEEYRHAGLISYLWCSESELKSYRSDVLAELHDFMRENAMDDSKQDLLQYKTALKLMLNRSDDKLCELDETTITSCEISSAYSGESDPNSGSFYSELIDSVSSSDSFPLIVTCSEEEESNAAISMHCIDIDVMLLNNAAASDSFDGCGEIMGLETLEI